MGPTPGQTLPGERQPRSVVDPAPFHQPLPTHASDHGIASAHVRRVEPHRIASVARAGNRRCGARHRRDGAGDRARRWLGAGGQRRRPDGGGGGAGGGHAHHAEACVEEPGAYLAQRGAAGLPDPRCRRGHRARAVAGAGLVRLAGLPPHRGAVRHHLARRLQGERARQAPLQRDHGTGRADHRHQPVRRGQADHPPPGRPGSPARNPARRGYGDVRPGGRRRRPHGPPGPRVAAARWRRPR